MARSRTLRSRRTPRAPLARPSTARQPEAHRHPRSAIRRPSIPTATANRPSARTPTADRPSYSTLRPDPPPRDALPYPTGPSVSSSAPERGEQLPPARKRTEQALLGGGPILNISRRLGGRRYRRPGRDLRTRQHARGGLLPAKIEVPANLGHDLHADRALASGVPAQEGVVRDDTDRPRYPAGALVHELHRLSGEHLRGNAVGRTDAPDDVRRGLLRRQRPKLAPERDTLLELAERPIVEAMREFRLSGDDDGQEFLLVRLDVREQPYLFEQFEGQALGLVDDQHRPLARGIAREQQSLELRQHRGLRGHGLSRQPEVRGEHFVELALAERRVVQVDDVNAPRQPIDCRPNHRRLAGARLANEQGDALAAGDAVLQIQEHLAVRLRHHHVLRVRRQIERAFAQSEKRFVHQSLTGGRRTRTPPPRNRPRPCCQSRHS